MRFWKYSVLGNTFVIVALAKSAGRSARSAVRSAKLSWVRALCHPEIGVAADGVALLEPSRHRLHIYNADGTRAEVSGNGARCAARWYFDQDGATDEVILQGDTGALRCRRHRGREVSVTLPPPRFASHDIPARGRLPEVWGARLQLPKPSGKSVTVHALSVGNPQCVVWGAGLPREWESLGEFLHKHRMFPAKTNVVFARRVEKGIEVRIWERGVGVTPASGTGAAAAAVVGARLGQTPRRVRVIMAGGTMRVAWHANGQIELFAPAELIAQGEWTMRRRA